MTTTNGNEKFIKVTPIISWAEIWQSCTDSRWLLWMLKWVPHTDSELRLFACWCARQAWGLAGYVINEDMVELAEQFAEGAADRQEMISLWEKRRGGATGAGVCGMPKCNPAAAVQLASFQTCRAEARDAAWSAAWYAATAAGFTAAREEADRVGWEKNCEQHWREAYRVKTFINKNPSIAKDAERIARGEQADWLREIMGNPMSRSDRGVPVPVQTLAYWMAWDFVPEKGMQDEWQFSSYFLSACVGFNTLVEEYSPKGVVVCSTDTTGQVPPPGES
jgi:hypothetical protein